MPTMSRSPTMIECAPSIAASLIYELAKSIMEFSGARASHVKRPDGGEPAPRAGERPQA